ncbi:nucleotidyltransferase domain-containing protein [Candidatus Pacearchaeota archaeon]|nr:nucleotidyltransferase domain-containing protein [Candidatus Pacearchaeota archaeon]
MESKDIIKKVFPILKKEKASRAGLFGSYARGGQKRGSDVDILVELPRSFDLFDLVRIKKNLEKVLKRNVDLVEYCVIKKQIKKQILAEEIRII